MENEAITLQLPFVGNILAVLAIAVLLIALLSTIVQALTSPLKRLPGPFLARFTRLWYLKSVWAGDFEKTDRALHEKYGPVVRIAPNEYSIDDPESVKLIYSHNTSFIKAPWYDASGNPDPNSFDLFTDRDPKRHGANRRKVAQLYSMTNLMQLEGYVTECTQRILDKFEELARTKTNVNMQHWLQCFAFDLIGLITLNKRFGFLDKGEDKGGLLAALHIFLFYCANVGVYAELHGVLFKLLALLPGQGIAYLAQFTQQQIEERCSRIKSGTYKGEETNDFLSKVLAMHADNSEKFSMSEVFTTCITNIGAGSDTTSISLSGILYHLLKSPGHLKKLRDEIDSKAAVKKISNPITFKEAQALPLLQACIKEGLRLHPATGLPLARVIPREGATLCGQFFPGGTVVGINTWVAHHNKNVFGEDCDLYRPERWLESTERSRVMERYFLTFGAGSRTCIGKNISLLEISKLIPELIRRFDFELADPEAELQTQNVWFVKQKNFYCRIRARSS